jgi:transposase InsO family protein
VGGEDPPTVGPGGPGLDLKRRIAALHAANYRVYGVRKMHAALVRDGMTVGSDQTGRLMRALGLAGVRRGRPVRTTVPDADGAGRSHQGPGQPSVPSGSAEPAVGL